MKVEIREHEGPRQCPYCHGSLGEDAVVECGGCATTYHADCAREVRSCATLGCRAPLVPAEAASAAVERGGNSAEPSPERRLDRAAVGLVVFFVVMLIAVPIVLSGALVVDPARAVQPLLFVLLLLAGAAYWSRFGPSR